MKSRIIALVAATVTTAAALAGPQTYATRTQPIRAGIVVLNSARVTATGPSMTSASFPFYNLDANRSVKPIGWNVYNPHAPGRVTTPIYTRYTLLGKAPPPVGTEITKRDAPYWEVFLDTLSTNDLSDYDILLVNPLNYVSLTSIEREKLRFFVDHGGVLWIDPSALPLGNAGMDPANNFPVSFMMRNVGGQSTDESDYSHPLLSRPFPISSREMNILNTGLPNQTFRSAIRDISQGLPLPRLFSGDLATFNSIRTISYSRNAGGLYTTCGVSQVGDGFVVITSRGAAAKLNRVQASGYDYTTNNGYRGLNPVLEQDGQASAKLVVNMISLLTQYRQQGGGAHKSGGNPVTLDAPMLARSSDRNMILPNTSNAAVLYKGMAIVSVGNHLVAYDPNPSRDLDGDGNPDDGQVDATPGSGVDILWVSPDLDGPISTPVVAEVPDSNRSIDQVLVVDFNGVVHAYNPVARTADNRRLDGSVRTELYRVRPPKNVARDTSMGPPSPPTIHEGMAYIADNYPRAGGVGGRLWVTNLRTGTIMGAAGTGDDVWYLGGSVSPFQAQPFAASPTVGYIPILDNSGGSDKVLYAPMQRVDNSLPAGLMSVWLGARGEKPANVIPQTDGSGNNSLQIETRASQQGGLPIFVRASYPALNPRISVLENGVPWTAAQMSTYFSGDVSQSGGILTFGLNSAWPTNVEVRLDYTIDWGESSFQSVAESAKRGFIQVPDQPGTPQRNISGPVAMTSKGTVYIAVSGSGSAGLYGFKEEGRGNFRCVMRYELYRRFSFNAQGRGQETFPPVVEDHDPVVDFAPGFLAQPFTSFRIVGAPAVSKDQVFINVAASKGLVPTSLLMAFRAEPEAPTFRVNNVPDGSVLVQPDVARSDISSGTAAVPTVFPSASYIYEPESQTLRIDNLMNIPKGQMQQCINLSQPVYLRTPGGNDVPIYPDSQGGSSWSPLLWYTVVNGYAPQTGPLVAGDTVFFGGQSSIRNILLNGNFLASNALLYAVRAEVSPSDDFLTITPGRPWLKQLHSLKGSGGTITGASPNIKWPQLSSVSSMSDFIIKLNQTILRDSLNVWGIAGGDGSLVALGDHGVYSFSRGDVIVADQGRIALFDGSGNPVWSTDSTTEVSPGGATGSVRKLVRPTRAYRLSDSEMLVVDSGANRVFRMNMAGFESRSLTEFQLDPNFRPSGFAANESQALSDPRDALTYSNIVYLPEAGGVSLGDGEAANAYEYWDHYLVADAGNRRLIEVIDRYAYDVQTQRILDPIKVNGTPQIGVLYWHSPAGVSGKQYAYNSISRVALPSGQAVYVAGIGSVLPTSTNTGTVAPNQSSLRETGTGNGGIVIFDPLTPNNPSVINSLTLPAFPANMLWNDSSGSFNSPASAGGKKYFSNIASVTTSLANTGGGYVVRIMVAEASGVYEANYVPGSGSPDDSLAVNWLMPNRIYRTMRFAGGVPAADNPRDLRVTYAVRVDADNVLITNGYYGQTRGGATFAGEIVQLDGTTPNYTVPNFGFGSDKITLKLSPVVGTRGLVLPVFADRR